MKDGTKHRPVKDKILSLGEKERLRFSEPREKLPNSREVGLSNVIVDRC